MEKLLLPQYKIPIQYHGLHIGQNLGLDVIAVSFSILQCVMGIVKLPICDLLAR